MGPRPGWLLHREAGGYSARFDGTQYDPTDISGGLICAPDRKSWQALHDALGDFFVRAKGDIKMGDTPSVARLLHGTPDDPSQPSWGGKFVRIWDGRKTIFDHLTDPFARSCLRPPW